MRSCHGVPVMHSGVLGSACCRFSKRSNSITTATRVQRLHVSAKAQTPAASALYHSMPLPVVTSSVLPGPETQNQVLMAQHGDPCVHRHHTMLVVCWTNGKKRAKRAGCGHGPNSRTCHRLAKEYRPGCHTQCNGPSPASLATPEASHCHDSALA